MKKWFLIVGTVILIMVLGTGMITLHGHGQRNYASCVRLGQNDVIDGKYYDALNDFQGARRVNPESSQVRNALDQTQSYVNGRYYLDRKRLNDAAKEYRRAIKIGSVAALNRRSMLGYKKVNVIQDSTRRFALWYDQALVLNHQQAFKKSTRLLDRIMSDPNVNLKYFKSFKARVLKLIRTDRHDKRSDQVKSNVGNRQNGADSFKLKSPATMAKYPAQVTIAKARRKIKRAGINVNEMNDHDVANLIRQAHQHHVSIYSYARKNY